MDLQVLKPFGPSVVKVKIPKKIVDDLNDYIDKIILVMIRHSILLTIDNLFILNNYLIQ